MKTAWMNDKFGQLAKQRDADLSKVAGPFRDMVAGQFTDDMLRANAAKEWDSTESKKDIYRQPGVGSGEFMIDPSLTKKFGQEDFQQDLGYDFRMKEGQKAIERSAAARGGLQSGGFMKSLGRYGQDYASGEYQNAYNRFTNDQSNRFNKLAALAGVGQTANSQLANAGQNYANQAGQNAMGAANAQGAAGIAGANAIGSGLSGIGKTWMDYSMMDKYGGGLFGGGAPGGGGGLLGAGYGRMGSIPTR